MRDLELRNAFNYSKNILSQVCGVPGSREAINKLSKEGDNRMGPKIIDGGFGVVAMFTIPALRSVIFDDHIENTKYVTSRIITSFVGDLGSCIGAGLLVADGRAVEGIGMKVAYNAFVAVAPDMVRPLKEAVHRFKAKLPFIAVI